MENVRFRCFMFSRPSFSTHKASLKPWTLDCLGLERLFDALGLPARCGFLSSPFGSFFFVDSDGTKCHMTPRRHTREQVEPIWVWNQKCPTKSIKNEFVTPSRARLEEARRLKRNLSLLLVSRHEADWKAHWMPTCDWEARNESDRWASARLVWLNGYILHLSRASS